MNDTPAPADEMLSELDDSAEAEALVEAQNAITARRSKVLQLWHRDMSEVQIAKALGVHQSTVSRDLKAIRDNYRAVFGSQPTFDAAAFVGESVAKFEDIWNMAMRSSAKPQLSVRDQMRCAVVAMYAQDRIIALLQDTGQIARSQGTLTLGLPSAVQIRAALAAAALAPEDQPPIIDVSPQ